MAGVELPRDEQIEAFVERFLTSFAAWDLLVLIHAQPEIRETPAQLAYRLGRNEDEIAEAIERMTDGGLLTTRPCEDGNPCYGLTADARQRELLDRFVLYGLHREWRMDLVRRVLAHSGQA